MDDLENINELEKNIRGIIILKEALHLTEDAINSSKGLKIDMRAHERLREIVRQSEQVRKIITQQLNSEVDELCEIAQRII